MPSAGTPRHTIRIADEIWEPAERRARSEGREVVDVIREHLTQYGIWDPAQARARSEGRDLNDVLLGVLREFLTQYTAPEEPPE